MNPKTLKTNVLRVPEKKAEEKEEEEFTWRNTEELKNIYFHTVTREYP